MIKQRYGVAGVPLCNCCSTCRWPRGKCPTYRSRTWPALFDGMAEGRGRIIEQAKKDERMTWQPVPPKGHTFSNVLSAGASQPGKSALPAARAEMVRAAGGDAKVYRSLCDAVYEPEIHEEIREPEPLETSQPCDYGACDKPASEMVCEYAPPAITPFLKRPMCYKCAQRTKKLNGDKFATTITPLAFLNG